MQLTEKQLRALKTEASVLQKVNHPSVLKVKEFKDNTLTYEPVPGEAITYELIKSLELKESLELFAQIASALEALHAESILHKDIKPEHIYYDKSTKRATLVGFHLASEVSRSVPFLEPEDITGTFRYMAPEQTGRMAIGMDERSDVYTLGMTMYEMYAGDMPWVEPESKLQALHQHLAWVPKMLSDYRPDLPVKLVEIIHFCIKKNIVDRYQSCFGLEHDLKALADQKIFKLKEFDLSNHFRLSDKLYGRDTELKNLIDVVSKINEKVSMTQTVHLYFIKGVSGIGKTKLVEKMHKELTLQNGHYYSAKFDAFSNAKPFAGMLDIMEKMFRGLLHLSTAECNAWKKKIAEGLGDNALLLLDYLPFVRDLLKPFKKSKDFKPLRADWPEQERDAELKNLFALYFELICTKDRPIVLFIDDLQWADMGSLTMLKKILDDMRLEGLLIIGAYRSNEVTEGHAFQMYLNKLKNEMIKWDEAEITPLKVEAVAELISDSTFMPKDSAEVIALSEFLMLKTKGNPFFITQILNQLYYDKIINIDHEAKHWIWDMKAVTEVGISDDIIELLLKKMEALDTDTKTLLKIAACTAGDFKVSDVNEYAKLDDPEALLHQAQKQGFVFEVGHHSGRYKFVHDKVQEALYYDSSEDFREDVHYFLGELHLGGEDVISVADHYRLAPRRVEEKGDKKKIADVLISGGSLASKAQAYDKAILLLEYALKLGMGKDFFTLYFELSKAYLRQFREEDYLNLEKVFLADQRVTGRMPLKCQLLYLEFLADTNKKLDCVKIGTPLLKKYFDIDLGDYKKDVSNLKLIPNLLKFLRVAKKLDLSNWKPDKIDEEAMQLTRIIINGTLLTGQIKKMTYMNLKYFLLELKTKNFTPLVLVRLMVLLNILQKWDLFTKWHPYIANKFETDFSFSKIAYLNYDCSYFSHIRDYDIHRSIEKSINLFELGQKMDERALSQFSILPHLWMLISKLSPLVSEAQSYILIVEKTTKNLQTISNCLSFLLFNHRLCKESVNLYPDQNILSKNLNEEKLLTSFTDLAQVIAYYLKIYWMILNKNYKQAFLDYEASIPTHKSLTGAFTNVDLNLLYPLTHFRAKKISYFKLKKVRKYLKMVHQYSPINWGFYHLTCEAECARFQDKDLMKAQSLYEQAYLAANSCGNRLWECLILELMVENLEAAKQPYAAYSYAKLATKTWTSHGCLNKARINREELFKHLFDQFEKVVEIESLQLIKSEDAKKINAPSTEASVLDVSAILKASGAFSKERQMAKILEKILEILLQLSGADEVKILISHEDQFFIEGKGKVGETLTTLMHELPPEDALIGAVKNGEGMQLKNEGGGSKLCFPILHQDKLIAALYLINPTTENNFTDDRISLLNALSSQMAISIENAKFYEILENKVKERTDELNAKNRDMGTLLSNLQQGLLTFNEDEKIGPEYSTHLESIFDTTEIADENVFSLLFDGCTLSDDLKDQAINGANMSMGMDEMSFDYNKVVLPKEIVRKQSILELDWQPLYDSLGCLEKIMLTIRDVTAYRQLEAQAKEQQKELSRITQLLDLGAAKFKDFYQRACEFISMNRSLILGGDKSAIEELFRNMHTLKGITRTFKLNDCTDAIHHTEQRYDEIRNGEMQWDSEVLLADLKTTQEAIDVYQDIFTNRFKKMVGNHLEVEKTEYKLEEILESELASLPELALALAKPIPKVVIDASVTFKKKDVNLLKDVFTHLLRNSMDHGLAKDRDGLITIKAFDNTITLEDNGKGINLGYLRKKKQGTDTEVAKAIFESGVSTATAVTDISGRGVGMDAVKSFLEQAGWSIELVFTGGMEGDEFRPFRTMLKN